MEIRETGSSDVGPLNQPTVLTIDIKSAQPITHGTGLSLLLAQSIPILRQCCQVRVVILLATIQSSLAEGNHSLMA